MVYHWDDDGGRRLYDHPIKGFQIGTLNGDSGIKLFYIRGMKTKTLLFLLLIFTAYHSYSQTREIYVNPNFGELTRDHKKLAILPFKMIIKLRPKQMEQMTPAQRQQLEKDEGLAVQSALQHIS